MTCRRVGVVPAKADPVVQEEFKKKPRTATGRSDGGKTGGVLCGCGAFCLGSLSGLSLVHAQSVCELLQKIADMGLHLPITLVLDNARYQKCAVVNEKAASLGIEMLYLPPYSPNLNLIERLWKFTKKQCLYSVYYPDFTAFKQAISTCLDQTHTTYKKELDSLLTLKFQSFEKVKTIA